MTRRVGKPIAACGERTTGPKISAPKQVKAKRKVKLTLVAINGKKVTA